MQQFIRKVFFFTALFVLFGSIESYAWLWGNKNLVTIDNKDFTSQDFKDWWKTWREKDTPFPENTDPFVEWHLLVREAETMELYREPTFQHKVNVFLKVRALMALKHEAIDSKIKVSEGDLQNFYRKEYVPMWHVQAFYFKDKNKADKIYNDLSTGKISAADLENPEREEKKDITIEKRWFRPMAFKNNKEWLDVLSTLKVNEYAEPFAMGDQYVVVHLLEIKGPDDEDFKMLKQGLRREVFDKRKGELNTTFFKELRDKYQVKIDDELLNMAGQENIPEEVLDKPLIKTNYRDIPFRHFQSKVQAELNVKRHGHHGKRDLQDVKDKVLNGVLFQTLTTWESLDRHYEERPPLEPIFRFYKQHRLIKELERKVFDNMITVSDNEISLYYQQHVDEFTPPELVSLAMWEGGEEIAEKIAADIARGVDFFEAIKKHSDLQAPIRQIPVNHLEAAVQEEVNKLVKGGVSAPFKKGKHYVIMKLITRKPASPTPLDKVKPKIAERLHDQRFKKIRAEYVEQLKERSTIKVNMNIWKKLRKELGEKK